MLVWRSSSSLGAADVPGAGCLAARRHEMKNLFIGIGALALCVGCNRVDLTTPGAVCEVHNIPLQEGTVPIIYGLMRPTKEDMEAERKNFPHSNSFYNPGCVENDPKWARVSFCPECRKAEALWKEAQKRKMAPIKAHWDRVNELVSNNPKFVAVHPFIRRGDPPTVGIEGHVQSHEDLDELKRLVEATEPTQPVYWTVRVSP